MVKLKYFQFLFQISCFYFLFNSFLVTNQFVPKTSSKQNPIYWNALFNTSDDRTFANLFLPPYAAFEQFLQSDNSSISIHLSQPCHLSLQQTLEALTHRQSWAVELLNAWAQAFPPTGAASGTLTDLGNFDQCLEVSSIPTQYCLLDYHLPMPRPRPKHHNFYHQTPHLLSPMEKDGNYIVNEGSFYRKLEQVSPIFYYTSIQIAICLPTTCSAEDVYLIGSKGIIDLGLILDKTNIPKDCQQKAAPFSWNNLNNWQVAAVIFIFALCLCTLLGALVDQLYNQTENKKYFKSLQVLAKCLRCFSPMANGRRLLKLRSTTILAVNKKLANGEEEEEEEKEKEEDDDDQLASIHGLRVLTLLIIIVGHTLDWNSLNMFRNSFSVPDRVSSLVWQPLYRGQLTVDTFFYLSGLLTSYITLKYTGGQYSRFSYLKYLGLRYLRLTPQLAAFLLLTALLPKLLDQGPVMNRYSDRLFNDHCYDNWWLNLLFVQNLVKVESICALHTWFLAADMQLHVLALPPLVTLLLNRRAGVRLAVAMLFGSLAWSSVTVYLKELPPGAIITSKADFLDEHGMPSEYLRFCYHPLAHAHVFFIGFLFGNYIRSQAKDLRNWQLSWQLKYALWTAVFIGYLITIYSMLPWLFGRPYNPLLSALVFPANLVLWSLVLTGTIGLCLTGNGRGIIGRLFSASLLKPLSRLTYSVYLTHVWVLLVALGGRREVIDLHFSSLVFFLLSVVLISFGVGFIFSVLVENPVLHAIDFLKEIKWSLYRKRSKSSEVIVTKFKPLEASLLSI